MMTCRLRANQYAPGPSDQPPIGQGCSTGGIPQLNEGITDGGLR